MSYKVQFLNDEEFEKLPGFNMGSRVGVAYPESKQAFVRQSGITAVDVFTAAHELEHLKGDNLDEHFDKENKCYYKGFDSIFQNLSPIYGASRGNFSPLIQTVSALAGMPMLGQSVGSMFGGKQQSPMQQFSMDPGQGSFQPQTQSQPNQIAGSSGPGSAGGPGGAPGSAGGGAVSKLKAYLQQDGNGGNGAGGMF